MTNMDEMFVNAVSFNQKLCGAPWVRSKASQENIFRGSSGSIPRKLCAQASTPATDQAPHQHVPHRPLPGRELIGRTPISTPFVTSMIDRKRTCPRCGKFRTSGRVSCCAPGGAWFKNCGRFRSKIVDHNWSEGAKACKCKLKGNDM